MTEPDRIVEHSTVTDHADEGVALLPRQFRTKEVIAALLRSWLTQAQGLEDTLWILATRNLDNSEGDALDQIGALLAFPRGELDDVSYRAVLRAIIVARKSSATGEDLHDVTRLLLGEIEYTARNGYASWLIEPHEPLPFSARAILGVLLVAVGGGVQLQLITPPNEETDLFTFSESAFFSSASASLGFSSTDQDDGGFMTGVID